MPQFRPKLPNLGSRPLEIGLGKPARSDQPSQEEGNGEWPAPAGVGPSVDSTASANLVGADVTPAGSPDDRPAGSAPLRLLRGTPRPFLHMPSLTVPSRAAVESAARELLSAPVEAARHRLQNPRELSDRIAMGRAIWRDLVIGFAAQLGELNLGFTQLAALYALADSGTMTVADLADTLGRSPSAVSRLVDGLVQRQLIERNQDAEDRRVRTLTLTGRGQALLGLVDRARAQEFLSIVRPLPTAERAVVAMGVAALSTHAISRRGHLIKQRSR
jgi:DNA-binding MarR family transcriptional regulator